MLQQTMTHAVLITGFVFMMMLIIEYLNVLSRGVWQSGLRGGRWRQYFLAAFLGATPGCLGAFAVVSLYLHREVSLGALVVAMVATSGDESFVMLSLIPQKAAIVFVLLFVVGIAAGYFTDALFGKQPADPVIGHNTFNVHGQEICHCFPWGNLRRQWRHCSSARGVLGCTLLLFVFAVCCGQLGPANWNWLRVTLVVLALVGFFIVATVPDHFLEEHLWNHVVKDHVPKVFLWTFGALLLMSILVDSLHLEGWIQNNQLIILMIACLVGLIPESGPHLLFLTLFVEGTIPFSIFMASSIVQDGHGMLPLLAESRRDFLKVKAINFAVGILTGFTGYTLGW
ncbi:putative manganese transporter [Desulforapulum autotrophicum]|nr:putative manganese transporter [Desulforapulum autotrophicum]